MAWPSLAEVAAAAADAYQQAVAPSGGDVAPAVRAHVEGYDRRLQGYWVHVVPDDLLWEAARFLVAVEDGDLWDVPESWDWYDGPICAGCSVVLSVP
ncbi:MAG TPA: hypothetical protein VKT52_02645 [Ktedonobacterales bacterium]|nr:hypothetical protein [Ktedonobacterales bacterium]